MKKADYIVIALFVTANCVAALLYLYYHPAVPLIIYFSVVLTAWYSAYRTCWWKKKNETQRGQRYWDLMTESQRVL